MEHSKEFIKINDDIILESLSPNDDYDFVKNILQNKDTMKTSSAFAGKIASNDEEIKSVLQYLSGKPPHGLYKIFVKSLDDYIGFGGLTEPKIVGGQSVTEVAMLLDSKYIGQKKGGAVLDYFFKTASKRLETVVCTAWNKNEISKAIIKKYNMQLVKSYQHLNDPDFIVDMYGKFPEMSDVIDAYSDNFASKKVSSASLNKHIPKKNYSTFISKPILNDIDVLQGYKTLEEDLIHANVNLMLQMPKFPLYQNTYRPMFTNPIKYNLLNSFFQRPLIRPVNTSFVQKLLKACKTVGKFIK